MNDDVIGHICPYCGHIEMQINNHYAHIELFCTEKPISDSELIDKINYWLDYFTKYGDKHYEDTADFRILEIYWDNIVSRVLEDLSVEDDQVDKLVERMSNLY